MVCVPDLPPSLPTSYPLPAALFYLPLPPCPCSLQQPEALPALPHTLRGQPAEQEDGGEAAPGGCLLLLQLRGAAGVAQ